MFICAHAGTPSDNLCDVIFLRSRIRLAIAPVPRRQGAFQRSISIRFMHVRAEVIAKEQRPLRFSPCSRM
jgi:hypothetical protein